jgi:hypothetical protein
MVSRKVDAGSATTNQGTTNQGSAVMGTRIYHQPRVAWHFARVVVDVATAGDDLYTWFSTRVADLIGPQYQLALYDTRTRLAQPVRVDAPYVEAGLWRARIDDLLSRQADLTEDLYILSHDASSRLARRSAPH